VELNLRGICALQGVDHTPPYLRIPWQLALPWTTASTSKRTLSSFNTTRCTSNELARYLTALRTVRGCLFQATTLSLASRSPRLRFPRSTSQSLQWSSMFQLPLRYQVSTSTPLTSKMIQSLTGPFYSLWSTSTGYAGNSRLLSWRRRWKQLPAGTVLRLLRFPTALTSATTALWTDAHASEPQTLRSKQQSVLSRRSATLRTYLALLTDTRSAAVLQIRSRAAAFATRARATSIPASVSPTRQQWLEGQMQHLT
jgi:hypothetical protein